MALYLVIVLGLCLCCYLFTLINFAYNLWWTPNRIQKLMATQGIKGPRYQFLHGSNKEAARMRSEAMATPMELSHDIVSRVIPHTYSWMKLYGPIFLNWIGPQPQLTVTDFELIKVVLENKDGAYQKSELKGVDKMLMGDGLAESKGEKWQKLRRLANHAFNGESLKDMIPAMIASVEMMLERWRNHEGKEIEVNQELKLLTSEVISRTAFGSSYLEGENIFDMLTKLGSMTRKTDYRIKIPGMGKLMMTRDDVEAERLVQGIRDSVLELIRKREERVITGEAESYGSDYLGLLLSVRHSDDATKKISEDDVIDECHTFYFAGQVTTVSLLTWTVFLLAINPDWQDKARAEVLELFSRESPSAHGIARMKNMGMIINETLRLYGPATTIRRKAVKDAELGELVVPANMEVFIPIMILHHSPEIWGEDVHMFKPERFEQGVAKATNDQTAAYLPFGSGSRFCVGLNFATNEAKIALSMILQRYRVTLSPNYVHSPAQILTVSPQHGLQIILHPL